MKRSYLGVAVIVGHSCVALIVDNVVPSYNDQADSVYLASVVLCVVFFLPSLSTTDDLYTFAFFNCCSEKAAADNEVSWDA